MPFEVGQSVSDYEILGVLGQGGMGAVYRARNIISNRVEALKILLADVASQTELSDRFVSEIRTLAQLDHPNIAKFHTAFKAENQLIMAMEFVEGYTLSDLASSGAIPLDQILSYATQTLSALSAAHEKGIIHRDVKPSNIMVTAHGVVKLMDFGIAKSNLETNLTRPGTTLGSMLYMSPEQVRGTNVDARSDIYSLGIVLYELTAGKRPFEVENTFAILDAHLNATPRPPIELNPQLPAALNEIILIALQKEPSRRFQTATAFRAALDTFRQHPTTAPPPQPATVPLTVAAKPPAAPAASKRTLWLLVAAIAFVCVLGGAEYTRRNYFSKPAVVSPAAAPASTTTAPPAVSQQTSAPDNPPVPVMQPPAEAAQVPSDVRTKVDTAAPKKLRRGPVSESAPVAEPRHETDTQLRLPNAATTQAAPAQEEVEKASEDLMKLHARVEAARTSLNRLRSEQASQGLGLRSDMSAAESRMDNYLGAADQAFQNGKLELARKAMAHADEDVTKIETFLGH